MLPSARIVRGAIALARWLPPGVFRALFRAAGAVGWLAVPGRRATLLDNVGHLVPDLAPRDRRRLARRTMRHLLEDASDLFRLPTLKPDDLRNLVRVEGLEHLEAARGGNRGTIIVTPHLGPYELGAAYVASLGVPAYGMVEDISAETNAALAAYRSATGLQLVTRTGGLRHLYRLLAGGAILLLVVDRVIGEGSPGLVVPFGDAFRRVPTGPAALALATDSMIVTGHIVRERKGPARYLLHMDPPISPNGRTRDDLTRVIAARLEAVIRQHPDQWYVFQPDWLSRDPGA